jgi:hypothetical protein
MSWGSIAVLLASVSPEALLAPVAPGFAAWQYHSAGAFGGSQYLVAWHDHRNGDRGSAWGALLTPAGARLGDDFEVLATGGHKEIGDVEFDGANFVVALEVSGSAVLQRVSPTGRPLDPAGIQVSEPWRIDGVPRLASNGALTVAVWAENRSPVTEIRAARIGRDGVVLDVGGVVVQSSMTNQIHQPDVAFDGTDFVVTWREAPRSLFLARLGPTLAVQGPGAQLIYTAASGELLAPRVNGLAGTPALSFVQGADTDTLRPFAIQGQPAAVPVALSPELAKWWPVELQFDGAGYLAVWIRRDDHSMRAARVNPSVSAVTSSGLLANGLDGDRPATLVLGGSGTGLALWQDRDRQLVFKGVVATSTLAVTAAGPVADSSGPQVDPSLAVASGRSLHAWLSPRYPMGTLVQLGVRSSGAPVVTDISMSSTSTESASVAASDTGALVTWLSEGRILARRVSLDGTPIDAQPFVVCGDGGGPVAVFDGTNYVIGFFAKLMNRYRLRVASVATDGAVATPCGQVVATTEVDSSNGGLSVATGNGTTTFVWEQRDSAWDPAVRVVRTRTGAAVDATPLTLAQWVGEAPSVTWNGTDFIVA